MFHVDGPEACGSNLYNYNTVAKVLIMIARSFVFRRSFETFGHRRTMENSKVRFTCPHCTKTYTRKANLDAHTHSHHKIPGAEPAEFRCSIQGCNRVFKRADLCSRHRRIDHG